MNGTNDGTTDDSGSHWSLLYLDRSNATGYQFDSRHKVSAHTIAQSLGVEAVNIMEIP